MSQVDTAHAWWSRLRHQGLLLSPVVMLERYATAPEPAHFSATARLRDAYTRFVSTAEMRRGEAEIEQSAILTWVDALLDPYIGHRWGRLARQGSIPEKLTAVVRIGTRSETIRPHRVVYADANATVPALLVMADTSAQVGRGRGRTVYARFLELLRGTGHRLGLLTNGYQFRLVYAGLDFESWCEWEADRWFDDGEGTEELGGLRQLLSPEALEAGPGGTSRACSMPSRSPASGRPTSPACSGRTSARRSSTCWRTCRRRTGRTRTSSTRWSITTADRP